MKKTLDVQIEKSTDGYDARFVVSSISPDRVGDTFSKAALEELAAKQKRTVALWQHDAKAVCGYWENFKMQGGKLVASLKLADTNLGRLIRSLLDSGVPLASSVGFRASNAKPNKSNGYEFGVGTDLMEISVVSTPANADAILLAKQYGFDGSVFTPRKVASGLTESEKRETLHSLTKSLARIEKWQTSQKS